MKFKQQCRPGFLSLLAILLVALALPAQTDPTPPPPPDWPAGEPWPPSANWFTWSWQAPEPPLPDTQWWDYGEGSTSNGPVPAVTGEVAQRRPAPPAPPMPPGLKAKLGTRNPKPEACGTFHLHLHLF